MTDYRKLAKGKDCQVRMISVCNRDPETTVLAYVRLSGVTGMGQKSPDKMGAWACSECHRFTEIFKDDDEIQRYFYEGVMRTQYELHRMGLL